MSTDLTGRTRVIIELKNIENLATKLKPVLDELNLDEGFKWTFGALARQCNVLLHEKLTIAATASQTLNLYDTAGSALQDAHGNDLTMEAIKFLFIKNTSLDLTVSIFGGGANDLLIMEGTTDAMGLPPESLMLWMCPTAAGIVTTANKNLKFAVGAGSGNAIINVVAMGND